MEYKNKDGYADPTAYKAIKNVMKGNKEPMGYSILPEEYGEENVFCKNRCRNTKCSRHITKAYNSVEVHKKLLLKNTAECEGYMPENKMTREEFVMCPIRTHRTGKE